MPNELKGRSIDCADEVPKHLVLSSLLVAGGASGVGGLVNLVYHDVSRLIQRR
jgi:hypothetical protein